MADILLRDIDADMAERIKTLARERGWPIHDVIMQLLKQGLGIIEPEPAAQPGDIARLNNAWQDTESRAFEEALKAFETLPDDQPY